MSDTAESVRRKINSALELESVVRSMKALAASSIGQYESAVNALTDYYRTVELGLATCVDPALMSNTHLKQGHDTEINAVVFGSDQGLVGQFNEVIVDFALQALTAYPGKKNILAVGERIHSRLEDSGLKPSGLLSVPNSVSAITSLIGQILIQSQLDKPRYGASNLYIFHNALSRNSRSGTIYSPLSQRLLPLDIAWVRKLKEIPWPTNNRAEIAVSAAVTNRSGSTLSALIREYLFVSLYKACAQSLASENSSRLAAMQRAEKNISELLEDLNQTFHRLRQSTIDEEMFDVISGFEALVI